MPVWDCTHNCFNINLTVKETTDLRNIDNLKEKMLELSLVCEVNDEGHKCHMVWGSPRIGRDVYSTSNSLYTCP